MKKRILLLLALAPFIDTNAQTWNLTGNTPSSTDFLGTTNNETLKFKVLGTRAGEIEYIGLNSEPNLSLGAESFFSNTGGTGNTAIGTLSMRSSIAGNLNTAIGYSSMLSSTYGSGNSALGVFSLFNNINGIQNIAIGERTLYENISGGNNVAIGNFAVYRNKVQTGLVGVGNEALRDNVDGYDNTGIGYRSLVHNTSGIDNTATGHLSMDGNVTGSYNTANGSSALVSNTRGHSNTAMGHHSMYSNIDGTENTAVGTDAMAANTKGSHNVAIGQKTLEANTTGVQNTACGSRVLINNTTGDGNTVAGGATMTTNTTGSQNTVIGGRAQVMGGSSAIRNVYLGDYVDIYGTTSLGCTGVGYGTLNNNNTGTNITTVGNNSDVTGTNFNNSSAFGKTAKAVSSDMIRIGNAAVTRIEGMVNWSPPSDARYKRNVKENVPGWEFISKLVPVTYTTDVKGIDKHYNDVARKNAPANADSILNSKGLERSAYEDPRASQIVYTGFLAQEVEKAAKEVRYDFSGVDKPADEDGLYGLRYTDFVPPLVNTVKEQQLQIETLQTMNDELAQNNAKLLKGIERIEKMLKEK